MASRSGLEEVLEYRRGRKGRMMLEGSGFGGRLVQPSVLATCLSLLVVSAALCALTAGCGGNAAKDYVTEANQILYDVNIKASELKKYWILPLADQGTMSKALADFRKSLGSAQERLDSAHPPQELLDLDEDMRRVVEKGRELAETYTPFADYFERAAPLANQITELVASVQAVQKGQDTATTILGFAEKAKAIDAEARSITPHRVFTGMHDEFEQFLETTVAAFEKASGRYGSSSSRYDNSENESYYEEDDYETTSPSDEDSSPKTVVPPGLQNVPGNWASFNVELSNIIDGLRDVVGVKVRNTEFENQVGLTNAEIQKLIKQYK